MHSTWLCWRKKSQTNIAQTVWFHLDKIQTTVTKSRSTVAGGWGGKRAGKGRKEDLQRQGEIFQRMDVFIIIIVLIIAMVSRVYIFVKTYQIAYFKHVEFIVCQLYLIIAVNEKRTSGGSHLHCLPYASKSGILSIIDPISLMSLIYFWTFCSTETILFIRFPVSSADSCLPASLFAVFLPLRSKPIPFLSW